MDEENKKMKTGRKVVIALIIILLALAAAAYGYGVNYFTDHFLPGSSVNGFNCSYKTSDETEELLAKEVQAYVLAVETRNNGQESITAKQAGLVYKSDGGASKLIRAQDRYKWFLAFNQKKKYNLATDTVYDDENKLTKAVKALRCMQKDNMEKPVNACIKDNGKTYEIQPEKEGTTLDTKKVQKVIRDAVSAGDTTVNLEKKNCYKKPSVYRDDKTLKKNCAQMNKITSCVITYDFSDRSEQLDRNTIKDWLTKDEKGEYTVDKNQVAAYVNSLGYKYDTFGCTRTFITYDGRQKTITGGDYGWAIDQTTETEWLYNALLAGTTEVRQPAYACQPGQSQCRTDRCGRNRQCQCNSHKYGNQDSHKERLQVRCPHNYASHFHGRFSKGRCPPCGKAYAHTDGYKRSYKDIDLCLLGNCLTDLSRNNCNKQYSQRATCSAKCIGGKTNSDQ